MVNIEQMEAYQLEVNKLKKDSIRESIKNKLTKEELKFIKFK